MARSTTTRRAVAPLPLSPALSLLLLGAALLAACGGDSFEGAGAGPVPSTIKNDALSQSRSVALLMVKDIAGRVTPEMGDAHVRLVKAGSREGREFRMLRDFLFEERERYGLTSLFTMVKIDKETTGLVLEAAERPGDVDKWMTPYLLERAMRRALAGKASVSREPWFDPSVRGGAPHIRAVAPILDGDEKVVAVIGFDLEVGDERLER
jgi:hypothetical protein